MKTPNRAVGNRTTALSRRIEEKGQSTQKKPAVPNACVDRSIINRSNRFAALTTELILRWNQTRPAMRRHAVDLAIGRENKETRKSGLNRRSQTQLARQTIPFPTQRLRGSGRDVPGEICTRSKTHRTLKGFIQMVHQSSKG
jgi:hypothetical protein